MDRVKNQRTVIENSSVTEKNIIKRTGTVSLKGNKASGVLFDKV